MHINDLYNKAVSGDKSAEEQLYHRLLVSFRAIVLHKIWNKLDGEEIVQEALLYILEKYKDIDIKSNFGGWAYQILKFKILDYMKTTKIRRDGMQKYRSDNSPVVNLSPDPLLVERIKQCFNEIHKLHRQHARILNLHFQGFSTDEICKTLNISKTNFYVSLSRARRMLEACINKKDDES